MTSPFRHFLRGALHGAPFLLVVAPFGILFGVVATEAGLTITQVMGFSIVVIAGASQFTALQLMLDNAPTVLVMSAALVVNLRMAMYAAALAPHFGSVPLLKRALIGYFNFDQSFAMGLAEYERSPDMSLSEKIGYFLGVGIPLGVSWALFTYIGAITGDAIPESYALDFAVPICFLAIVAPGLKSAAHVAAAFTSIILALGFAWMPSGLGLIIAALIAMAVGAEVERRMAHR